MPNWMNTDEAMNYFGISLEELEALVVEHDVDVDTEDGVLVAVDADDCKELLFKVHEQKVGHRPDDFNAMEKAKKEHEEKEKQEKKARQAKKSQLVARVSRPE